eukprot:3260213-Rhodomonas_salina.7
MSGSKLPRGVPRCHVHGIVRFRTHWGNLGGLLNGSVTFHKGDITGLPPFPQTMLPFLHADVLGCCLWMLPLFTGAAVCGNTACMF